MKPSLIACLLLGRLLGSLEAAQLTPISVEPAKSIVFTLSQNADLWFFNNQSPSNYHTAVALTAAGPAQGSFSWNIVANSAAAEMSNGTDSITVSAPSVDIKSIGISTLPNDVWIGFKYNGEDVGIYKMTAYAPTSVKMDPPTIEHTGIDTAFSTGYVSRASFIILDQFNQELPADVPMNEFFGMRTEDYAGNNWGSPAAVWTVGRGFTDTWEVKDRIPWLPPEMNPHPTPPQSPELSSVKVFHLPQGYAVGSLSVGVGRQVELHTLEYYVDHANVFPVP